MNYERIRVTPRIRRSRYRTTARPGASRSLSGNECVSHQAFWLITSSCVFFAAPLAQHSLAAGRTGRSVVTGVRWLTRQEAAVLVAVLIILLALFGFVRIAEELGESKLANFDEWLLRLLRVPGLPHVPVGPSWLMEAAHDITALGGRTMLLAVTLFAIGYLSLERKYGAMWLVAAATGGGGLLSTIMKDHFGRDRPEIVSHLVAVTSPSFPSGHSMLAAILYLTLGALLARFATRHRTTCSLRS